MIWSVAWVGVLQPVLVPVPWSALAGMYSLCLCNLTCDSPATDLTQTGTKLNYGLNCTMLQLRQAC